MRNPVMGKIEGLERPTRAKLLGVLLAVNFLGMLIFGTGNFALVLLPMPFLLVLGLVYWAVSNLLVYTLFSIPKSWKSSTRHLLGYLWSALTLAAILFMLSKAPAVAAVVKGRPNLTMYGTSPDQSYTLYFYRNGGNAFEGYDIDVTMEAAEEPGVERPVCSMEKTHEVGLIWKDDTSFKINGMVYIVEDGEAVPQS